MRLLVTSYQLSQGYSAKFGNTIVRLPYRVIARFNNDTALVDYSHEVVCEF